MRGQWQTVAQGTSLWDLQQTIADMELPKGSRMRIQMDTGFPWVFDLAGAELAFKPFVPSGMDLVDVWGEGNQGIVELESDPIWLAAALAFIKAHWLAIIIAGFVLTAIIAFIRIMVWLVVPSPVPVPALAWIAILALGAYALFQRRAKAET